MYRAAARFFESLRILEHRPKSAKRLKEEAAFGKFGRSTQTVTEVGWVCLKGDRLVHDELGRVRLVLGDGT